MGTVLGLDASRNRSGGARAHLIGILGESDPREFGIQQVHLWSYRRLLEGIPDAPWLVKHNPPEVERGLGWQLWWQYVVLPREARRLECSLMFGMDAGTVCPFTPAVTLSQDMLSYEAGERQRYGWSVARLRLEVLRHVQARSMKRAEGVIFLTNYASNAIQAFTGPLRRVAVIPHGVSDAFRGRRSHEESAGTFRVVYVSNTAPYKHQWHVVRAVRRLRDAGHRLTLTLVGGGRGSAQARLEAELAASDPQHEFVTLIDQVHHEEIPGVLADADLFLFASSCENLPITLLEGMASGLPIACSNRGPMPEVLQDGGVYFDPEDPASIARALETLATSAMQRRQLARRAEELSQQYTWKRAGHETWTLLHDVSRSPVATATPGNTAITPRAIPYTTTLGVRSRRSYQVCVNCVMDTTDSSIKFDETGLCDHCRRFARQIMPHWHADVRGRESLQRHVDRIRLAGKGHDFDCIIGMSGGVDSSYLTYLAKEELGLRPLVFHVDTGWNSQEAVNNIERLVDGLGLDLYTEVINWEEMRDLQLAFFKARVPHIDTPQDHAIFATMYRFAEQHKISHILTGANYSTEAIRNPVEWMYYQSDSTQLLDIHRKHGTRPLATFPLTSILWHKIFLRYIRGIEVVRPLNFMPYMKEDAMKLLAKRYGWQPYPQKHFESRFTRFYESFWLPTKFGYDVRRVQYSSLIVTRQMTRSDAIEKLRLSPYDEETIDRDIEFVAAKLGISRGELLSYLDGPNRTYRDYRSQAYLYGIGAAVMRAAGLERGGKR